VTPPLAELQAAIYYDLVVITFRKFRKLGGQFDLGEGSCKFSTALLGATLH
jgi:hypothetical protein